MGGSRDVRVRQVVDAHGAQQLTADRSLVAVRILEKRVQLDVEEAGRAFPFEIWVNGADVSSARSTYRPVQ